MPLPPKKWLIPSLSPVVAVGLVWLFIAFGPVLQARERQDGWNHHPGQLNPGMSYGQTFICREPDLCRIDIRLGTYGHPLPPGVKLHLVEIADNLPEPLARPIVTGGGIQVEVADGGQLGQTFIPRRPGLNGLWLDLDSRALPDGAEMIIDLWLAGRYRFLGNRLARRVIKVNQLPRLGFSRIDFDIPARAAKDLPGQRLLFTVQTRGAQPGRGLKLRFVSDNWDYKQVVEASTLESTWIPQRTYGRGGVWLQAWEYWLGDLVFRPAYPASVPDGPVLRSASLAGWQLADNGFNSFSFPPLADSKGKRYYCYLTLIGDGPGVTVLADTKARYPYGRLVLDGVPTRGSLAFRAYTRLDRGRAAGELMTLTALNKPGVFGLRWLLPLLIVCLVGLLGLLLFGVLAFGDRDWEGRPKDL